MYVTDRRTERKILFGSRPVEPNVRTEFREVEAQWPIGCGVGLRIKRSSVRIRPWPLRLVLGQGSLLPLSQGEAFTLASISYLAILVKYILAKKKKKKKKMRHYFSTLVPGRGPFPSKFSKFGLQNHPTVTCCRRLSRDCFGDVLHNIFGKERLAMTIAQIRVVLTSLDTRGYIENHRQRTGEG